MAASETWGIAAVGCFSTEGADWIDGWTCGVVVTGLVEVTGDGVGCGVEVSFGAALSELVGVEEVRACLVAYYEVIVVVAEGTGG